MDATDTTCILGAGLAGLSAAYDLGRQGHRVTVLEAAPEIGGLASSITVGGTPVERFYHFICRNDTDLIELAGELGLAQRLTWRRSSTCFYYHGRLYSFGSPLDLLRFKPVPFNQRVRFGFNVIHSRYRRQWRKLDRISAYDWLTRKLGRQAYDVIWDPLLRIKFGDACDKVSAAWIWHRIHRAASSRRHIWGREYFGFLDHGSSTIIDGLTERLKTMPNVELRTAAPVQRIATRDGRVSGVQLQGAETLSCRYVISTIALPHLLQITPDFDEHYRRELSSIEYLGVVCGLMKLSRPLTRSFWMNINDPQIPFNGVIEYTNLNDHPRFDGFSIAYVPYYLRTSHPRFGYDDEQLRREFEAGFKRVNPEFEPSWIEECHISRTAHAQAICTVGFADMVPKHATPIDGLHVTDSAQFYPEDRTISAAIRLGRQVASMIIARTRAGD